MSRLVVVSNRTGDLRNPTQTGGLAVAVADALRARGGVWFGWNGNLDSDRRSPAKAVGIDQTGNVQRVSVSMPTEDYQQYYVGYANSVLWPLFHYRPDLVRYQQDLFEGYLRANASFASALMPFLHDDDIVWVHDYHLIPFAAQFNRNGRRQKIGFFLHIPFPPPDLLAASPDHSSIVEALLQYDLVGFQTFSDLSNFCRAVREMTTAEVSEDGLIRHNGRTLRAGRFPIGIDVDAFADLAARPFEDVLIDQIRREVIGRKQIIGVDRLDYSKGLPARFRAFEKLLSDHPELKKSVSYLQIAPPTREDITAYSDIRIELEGLAGSINGRFAEFNWTPICYIHRTIARERLAAMLRTSQVGLVTPVRDGMNLVAKEYVAAQDPLNPGVLVLSQFAGAAEEMPEAVIVNPHDVDALAKSLYIALTMPLTERRERHGALLERIRRFDVNRWAAEFLAALTDPPDASAGDRTSVAARAINVRGGRGGASNGAEPTPSLFAMGAASHTNGMPSGDNREPR